MKSKSKKPKLKPLPILLKDAEEVFNRWVRNRALDGNEYFTCINCGKVKDKKDLQAGHMHAVRKSSFLRFHEDNVWGECSACNCYDQNKIKYQFNVLNKIGYERVKWMNDNWRNVKRWSREELENIIEHYKLT